MSSSPHRPPGSDRAAHGRDGQVIFALTNPTPRASPTTQSAGAAFGLEGSIVNVLGYPGIFRGALLAGAEDIDLEMKLAAARAIADLGERAELVPNALDPIVHERVSEAVRAAAERSGAARPELAAPGL